MFHAVKKSFTVQLQSNNLWHFHYAAVICWLKKCNTDLKEHSDLAVLAIIPPKLMSGRLSKHQQLCESTFKHHWMLHHHQAVLSSTCSRAATRTKGWIVASQVSVTDSVVILCRIQIIMEKVCVCNTKPETCERGWTITKESCGCSRVYLNTKIN